MAAAIAGETITINDAALYNEGGILVDKQLTIQGQGLVATGIGDFAGSTFDVTATGDLTLTDLFLYGTDDAVGTSGITVAPGGTLSVDTVVFDDLGFDGCSGCAIAADEATVTVNNSQFYDNGTVGGQRTANQGGAIRAQNTDLTVSSSYFLRNLANNGGGIYVLQTAAFSNFTAIRFNDFAENRATGADPTGRGGAVYLVSDADRNGGTDTLDVGNNLFCQNSSTVRGAGMFIVDMYADDTQFQNNVFAENSSQLGGGLYWFSSDREVSGRGPAGLAQVPITNNTFAGNNAQVIGGGGGAIFDGVLPLFVNNIVTNSTGGTGLAAQDYNLGDAINIEYSLFFQNNNQHLGSDLATEQFTQTNFINVNPDLLFWGNDGNCEVDAFYTSAFSQAVNNGDESIFDTGGSISDIGAYGGPRADTEDSDGDGWENVYDCDESRNDIYPGATEICDGIDNDCDGVIDDGFNINWYTEGDGDGVPPEKTPDLISCSDPANGMIQAFDIDGDGQTDFDCDDADGTVYPGNMDPSIVNNGVDNTCDLAGQDECFDDNDADGHGDDGAFILEDLFGDGCLSFQGESALADDCDDGNNNIYPGNDDPSVVSTAGDNDCDGHEECFFDGDMDDHGDATIVNDTADDGCLPAQQESLLGDDCNDGNATVFPGNTDPGIVDNGVDNTCDFNGYDECFIDADRDGRGNDGGALVEDNGNGSCVGTEGESAFMDDCDDADATVFPGNNNPTIVNNGVDNDCDTFDECFADVDQDGHGSTTVVNDTGDDGCLQGQSESTLQDDCLDTDADVYPGNTDPLIVDNGVDNTCDINGRDECFLDADRDGRGTDSGAVIEDNGDGQCNAALSESTFMDDCNDADGNLFPGNTNPNVVSIVGDNDCDGHEECFVDGDGDGHGTDADTITNDTNDNGCLLADGEATSNTDCNDANADIYPGNTDPLIVDNGIDNTCDLNGYDECFRDNDRDGFGGDAQTVVEDNGDGLCNTNDFESGDSTDCNDANAFIFPGNDDPATVPTVGDNDCDGHEECYVDADGDGRGGESATVTNDVADDGCLGAQNESGFADDCNDADNNVFPGNKDPSIIDDGFDNTCDVAGQDECWFDNDRDGFGTTAMIVVEDDGNGACDPALAQSVNATDCNDNNAGVFPGNDTEFAVNTAGDNNCDNVEECWFDNDMDGYGSSTIVADTEDDGCDPAQQQTSLPNDCDDNNATIEDPENWYPDVDGDGLGANVVPIVSCTQPQPDMVTNNTDCNDNDPTNSGEVTHWRDVDQDGYGDIAGATIQACLGSNPPGYAPNDTDCAPDDSAINPGAIEVCDTIDNDCDTFIDEAGAIGENTYYADGDGDTWVDISDTTFSCASTAPAGYAVIDTARQNPFSGPSDCDDTNNNIFPFNTNPNIVDDGVDNTCDVNGRDECFRDSDKDGFGTTAGTIVEDSGDGNCLSADFESLVMTDCSDFDANTYPGNTNSNTVQIPGDNDCDGHAECYVDADFDGHGNDAGTINNDTGDDGCNAADGESLLLDDCNDADGNVFPGNTNPSIIDNGVDNTCDVNDRDECFRDSDQDGFGTEAGSVVEDDGDGICSRTKSESLVATDCADFNAGIYPGNVESYVVGDLADNDCDDHAECFVDADGDGRGTDQFTITNDLADDGCNTADNESIFADDCDDADNNVFPGNTNPNIIDDGADNTCDPSGHDECFLDADRDGHGAQAGIIIEDSGDGVCDTAQSEATIADDCQDNDGTRYPGNTDPSVVADSGDNDCDNLDECFQDADGDTFGSSVIVADTGADGCLTSQNEADDNTDCDDGDAGAGAPIAWYPDNDGDGLGASVAPITQCTAPVGAYVDNNSDCDDNNASNSGEITHYRDTDNDGFGATGTTDTIMACDGSITPGYANNDLDCNDTNNQIQPLAIETCATPGVDDDCDGQADEEGALGENLYYADGDGDTWVVIADINGDCGTTPPAGYAVINAAQQHPTFGPTDCDDTNADVFPGNTDPSIVDDGIDNTCDVNGRDECFADADSDGFGGAAATIIEDDGDGVCTGIESDVATDCDDFNINTYPGNTDPAIVPLPGDNDCDGHQECYFDADFDGRGDPAMIVVNDTADDGCNGLDNESAFADDCDDANGTIFPGNTDPSIVNDGIDNTCDVNGRDECFLDNDRDGVGGTLAIIVEDDGNGTCDAAQAQSATATDCNDSDAFIYPGNVDPNVVSVAGDNDCDGLDECFNDGDQDSYGGTAIVADTLEDGCNTAQFEADDNTDCDDANAAVGDPQNWYPDADGDGLGANVAPVVQCTQPQPDMVNNNQDCDDNNTNNSGEITHWRDTDLDGFGDANGAQILACLGNNPAGYAPNDTDCDDTNRDINPNAIETCATLGVDDDCDNLIDEEGAIGENLYYADADGDTWVVVTDINGDCGTTPPVGYAVIDLTQQSTFGPTDCDDNNINTFPGNDDPAIVAMAGDNNCDINGREECFRDSDNDGFGGDDAQVIDDNGDGICDNFESLDPTDCADFDPNTYPGNIDPAVVVIVGDNDCDLHEECYTDGDQDGFGTDAGTVVNDLLDDGCNTADFEATVMTDCNDTRSDIYPGNTDPNIVADGVDNTCDVNGRDECFVDADADGFGQLVIKEDDGDGFCLAAQQESDNSQDCADFNVNQYPGNTDVNSVADPADNDCDGHAECYFDNDMDGHGDENRSIVNDLFDDGCDGASQESSVFDDCNDNDDNVYPGNMDPSIIENGVDNTCDPLGQDECYRDGDGDGHGTFPPVVVEDDGNGTCDLAQGQVTIADDCNDGNGAIYPGNDTDIAVQQPGDNDCDALEECYFDNDNDGFGGIVVINDLGDDGCQASQSESLNKDDCDDANGAVGGPTDWYIDADGDGLGTGFPITQCNPPVGNYVDNNSDCDDANTNNSGEVPHWRDTDFDGYGDPASTSILACLGSSPPGYAPNATDCDDTTSAISPVAPERCDTVGIDDDCDGQADEAGAVGEITYYADFDSDLWADVTNPTVDCNVSPPAGYITLDPAKQSPVGPSDCNDSDATVFPGNLDASTVNNGIDNDCDINGRDECFQDIDQDGYGSAVVVQDNGDGQCLSTNSESVLSTDCNDVSNFFFPGNTDPATVAAPGDQDCDGHEECYVDNDMDGHGGDGQAITNDVADDGCNDVDGESLLADDCNDNDATVYPGNVDPSVVSNGIDNTCDINGADECFRDLDRDGFGDVNVVVEDDGDGACRTTQSESADSTDCSDGRADIYPGNVDPNIVANPEDQDCDGHIECFVDADMDGHGTDALTVVNDTADDGCNAVDGEAVVADDCNDSDNTVYPGNTDPGIVANGVDNTCDLLTNDECFADGDRDGYGTTLGIIIEDDGNGTCDAQSGESPTMDDCSDGNATIHPNNLDPSTVAIPGDNDCDALDECFYDGDADGFGDTLVVNDLADDGCLPAQNETDNSDDCDDSNPTIVAPPSWYPDTDGDGLGANVAPVVQCTPPSPIYVSNNGDCDDANATNQGEVVHYRDADADGFGDPNGATTMGCPNVVIAGFAPDTQDCNDGNAAINPNAIETCATLGVDDNCNGVADESGAVGENLYYGDADADGWVDLDITTTSCSSSPPPGFNDLHQSPDQVPGVGPDDCDDLNPNRYPVTWYADADGDGLGAANNFVVDCDPPTPAYTMTPGDCDDSQAGVGNLVDFYRDVDGDGFGDPNDSNTVLGCPADVITGFAPNNTDCAPTDAAVNPNATETCATAYDDNCNGDLSDPGAIGSTTYYYDGDADGWADVSNSETTCTTATAGYIALDPAQQTSAGPTDCDDASAVVNPGVVITTTHVNDTVDNNCDGFDECYADADFDGQGSDQIVFVTDADSDGCATGAGESDVATDCNDASDSIYLGAVVVLTQHIGDQIDQDCDGFDECLRDDDGDGYGNDLVGFIPDNEPVTPNARCNAAPADPDGIPNSGDETVGEANYNNVNDCDDTDAAVNPGAMEECATEGVDDDCDGRIDEADSNTNGVYRHWVDQDGDGFGDPGDDSDATVVLDCAQDLDGHADNFDDCDDSTELAYPGNTEICEDAIDNDCDDEIDEPDGEGAVDHWLDQDNDGHGAGNAKQFCIDNVTEEGNWVPSDGRDCDDTDPEVGVCGKGTDCGCSASASDPRLGYLVVLVAAGVLSRRRRPSRRNA